MPDYEDAPRRPPGAAAPAPATPGAPVTLRAVDRGNVRAICDTRVAADQRHLVGPAAYTIAEGLFEPKAILRGIFASDVPVGVLLVEVESGTPYLVRFMIDAAQQGRGLGRAAVECLADELRSAGWNELEVTFMPTEGGAEGFWRACGFNDTGRVRDDEPVFVRRL